MSNPFATGIDFDSVVLVMPAEYSRKWMFTINNPISVDIPRGWEKDCEFVTWQLEVGEKETPHLQGMVSVSTMHLFTLHFRLFGYEP